MSSIGSRRNRATMARIAGLQLGESPTSDKIERAFDEIIEPINELITRSVIFYDTVTLVTGSNRIIHGIGRKPVMVTVTPMDANASYAWGWDPGQSGNPNPNRQTDVTVAGGPFTARIKVE